MKSETNKHEFLRQFSCFMMVVGGTTILAVIALLADFLWRVLSTNTISISLGDGIACSVPMDLIFGLGWAGGLFGLLMFITGLIAFLAWYIDAT